MLVSPPGTPSYNGASKAGIGGLKTRAHHLSARYGRPGQWTCDDVEGARLLANLECLRLRRKRVALPIKQRAAKNLS